MAKEERNCQSKKIWPACKLCVNVDESVCTSGLNKWGCRTKKKIYRCELDNEKVSPKGHCTEYELR